MNERLDFRLVGGRIGTRETRLRAARTGLWLDCSTQPYHTIHKKGTQALAHLLTQNGQARLPMVELIEESKPAVDKLIDALGLAEGASENQVVKGSLEDLVRRGMRPDRRRLFVVDGSKALRAAVDAVFGGKNPVQRCRHTRLTT